LVPIGPVVSVRNCWSWSIRNRNCLCQQCFTLHQNKTMHFCRKPFIHNYYNDWL